MELLVCGGMKPYTIQLDAQTAHNFYLMCKLIACFMIANCIAEAGPMTQLS
jgi:hypothetical protein